jgi:hypothetical protein
MVNGVIVSMGLDKRLANNLFRVPRLRRADESCATMTQNVLDCNFSGLGWHRFQYVGV